jgi:hypothetical protein
MYYSGERVRQGGLVEAQDTSDEGQITSIARIRNLGLTKTVWHEVNPIVNL